MIQIAKQDIKLYKNFQGTNSNADAPIQETSWGRLRAGRLLKAYEFNPDDGICTGGVHAAAKLIDAKRSGGDLNGNYIVDSRHKT